MNKKKLILTSSVANTFEWYDYALFGHFAPIIGMKFFPDSDPNAALLQAFLIFAVGYLMRPLGGVFFGIIGDKFGRKVALSSAVMFMAIPTAAIGFLPTYETWGIASTRIMIILRLLQGLSMGGALTGSVAFLIEHSNKSNRGFFGSIPMASICVGILLGSLTFFVVKNSFSAEAFDNWAWRLPFIIGIAIYFAGLYIKNNAAETPLFEEARYRGEVVHSPLKEVFNNHWRDMLISIFINATGSIIFYLEAIYLISYLKITRGFEEIQVNYLVNFCYILMIFVTLLSGWLSDKFGRRRIIAINLVVIMITMPFLLKIFETGEFAMVALAQILVAIMAATYIGPEPALQAEFYPTEIRNTALSISYNTATSLFGGTAPYVIEYLIQRSGSSGAPGSITDSIYYIFIMACLSLVALYFYRDRSLQDHKVAIDYN
jgi:MHS family proline/betaine transporter-like MFS transporter